MPAPLDDPRAFMEWLVHQAGSQSSLAQPAGLLPSTVSDYVRGKNEPRLPNTLAMMRAARVVLEGAPPSREAEQQERLEAIERRQGELVDAVEDVLRIVRRLVREPAGEQPGSGRPD